MKKFLFAVRSIGLTIVGLVIAILVTRGLHSFFGLFLDPLPMAVLEQANDEQLIGRRSNRIGLERQAVMRGC